MKPVLALTFGIDHPSSRLRVSAYREALAQLGWRLDMHFFAHGMGSIAPLPATFRQRIPWRLSYALRTLRMWLRLARLPREQPLWISREVPAALWPLHLVGNPLVLDIDDALYLGVGRSHILQLCRRASAVVCGNSALADELSPYARRCVVIPTVVDCRRYQVRTNHELSRPLRLGWLGSSLSVDFTLTPWLETLRSLRGKVEFELVTILDSPPRFVADLPWARHLTWSPEIEHTLSQHIDVGLMPLSETPFLARKCGAKLLQYMAAGLPTIASPVGVNRELVSHGLTGYWATTTSDWHEAILRLAASAELRSAMGQAGRRAVEEGYSVTVWAPRWAALLESLQASSPAPESLEAERQQIAARRGQAVEEHRQGPFGG